MHIPDGFLDTKTWVGLGLISGALVGLSIWKSNKTLGEKHIPLMGIMAAFIFTSQMLAFPVPGGTTGHFMGGALAAIVLGPYMGMVVITSVLMIQCLVFQDGGLTALGANIFNMGVIGVFFSYFIYKILNKLLKGVRSLYISSFIAAFLTVILSAAACAAELAVSGTVPAKVALATMVSVHFFIGIGEGVVTATALGFIRKVRPELLADLS